MYVDRGLQKRLGLSDEQITMLKDLAGSVAQEAEEAVKHRDLSSVADPKWMGKELRKRLDGILSETQLSEYDRCERELEELTLRNTISRRLGSINTALSLDKEQRSSLEAILSANPSLATDLTSVGSKIAFHSEALGEYRKGLDQLRTQVLAMLSSEKHAQWDEWIETEKRMAEMVREHGKAGFEK